MGTRWQESDAPRGDEYDARWRRLAAKGASIHGEADLVETLLRESSGRVHTPGAGGHRVLDAGCGTGRVAIELAARGFSVAGMDSDPRMLDTARAKAPELSWVQGDLTQASSLLDDEFDLIALAGNVMIFLNSGTEGRVLRELSARLKPGALLVAGFSIQPGRLPLAEYDRLAEAAGLHLVDRWATWEQEPYAGGDYAVTAHARSE